MPPLASYVALLKEADRKTDPLASVPVADVALLVITPRQMNAPDIIKAVITIDGVLVQPVVNQLTPTPMQNGFGRTMVLHSGTLAFPSSILTKGSELSVTLIPESGQNIVFRVTR